MPQQQWPLHSGCCPWLYLNSLTVRTLQEARSRSCCIFYSIACIACRSHLFGCGDGRAGGRTRNNPERPPGACEQASPRAMMCSFHKKRALTASSTGWPSASTKTTRIYDPHHTTSRLLAFFDIIVILCRQSLFFDILRIPPYLLGSQKI